MSMIAIRLFLAASLVLSTLSAQAQKDKHPEPRKEFQAWYIFFAGGKSPNRQVFIMDGRHKRVSDDVFEIQAVTLLETPKGEFDHWAGTLQFKATPEHVALAKRGVESMEAVAKTAKVRTVSGYQMHADGKVVHHKPTEWSAFKTAIDLLSFRIACDPEAMETPEAYGMVFVGNFFRPVDVVDVVRKVLPNIKDLKDAK